MKHCCIDIETLGTGQDAMILSIGAVKFDPATGLRGKELLIRVDPKQSKSPGQIDYPTVEWWLKQDQQAIAALLDDPEDSPRVSLERALVELGFYLETVQHLWSNGPLFDERILREAYARHSMKFPVHYRDSRCCRTLGALTRGLEISPIARHGVHHDALDDANFQARLICLQYQALKLTGKPDEDHVCP